MCKIKFKFLSNNEKEFLDVLNGIDVIGNVRPLRVQWTPEITQDLDAMYGFDTVQEVIQRLSEEMAIEIDREMLSNLRGLEYVPQREMYGDFPIGSESRLKKIKRFKFFHKK